MDLNVRLWAFWRVANSRVCLFSLFSLSLMLSGVAAREPFDSRCDLVGELERVDSSEYLLAVRQSREWLVCRSGNAEESPYAIALERLGGQGELKNIEFRWAVPSSESRRVVYASTMIAQTQPISLYRNSSSLLDAFYFVILGRNEDEDLEAVGSFDASSKESYISHHLRGPSDVDIAVKNALDGWHDTALWGAGDTRILVRSTLLALPSETGRESERGAERLIRVQGSRPRVSWIPFRSQPPYSSSQSRIITVTLAYSGDAAETFRPYRFYFLAKE